MTDVRRTICLVPLAILAGCAPQEDAGTPHVGDTRQPIIYGVAEPDAIWETQGRVVSLDLRIKSGLLARCSGIVFPDGWVLTAAHCVTSVAKADGSPGPISITQIAANFAPPIGGVWDGLGATPSDANWRVQVHPRMDLALIKPLNELAGGSIPIVPADWPITNAEEAINSLLSPVLGFGCSTVGGAGGASSSADKIARSAKLTIASVPEVLGPLAGGNGNTSFGVRAIPIQSGAASLGQVAPGDSGGPAFHPLFLPKVLFGEDRTLDVVFGVTKAGLGGSACPASPMTGQVAQITTLRGRDDFLPHPILWLNETRAKLTPKIKTVPAIIPPTGGNDITLPQIGWADFDGDKIADLYAWTDAGLTIAKNSGEALAAPVKALAESFVSMLPDTQPQVLDLTGDGHPETLFLTSLAGVPALTLYPGVVGTIQSGAVFGAPLPAIPFPDLTGVPLPSPTIRPTAAGAAKGVALLADGLVSFVEYPNAPLVYGIEGLDMAAGNFRLADVDGNGRDELIVTSSAGTVVYRYRVDNGETVVDAALPLPSDCPLPFNDIQIVRVDQDAYPDFVCIRPGTIEVRLGTATPYQFGEPTRSPFPFYLPVDPALQKLESGKDRYFWNQSAYFVDITGDGLPDYVNASFTQELWFRPGFGKGSFGPLEAVNLGSDPTKGFVGAFGFHVLPPVGAALSTFAVSNASPSGQFGGQSVAFFSFAAVDLDKDKDGIFDSADNCPSLKNESQVDGNKDGRGDSCDNAKCGPDADGDKIADAITSDDPSCGSEIADNCVGRANSDQANGNRRAELDNEATELGDACDPVPYALPVPAWTNTSTPAQPKCVAPPGGPVQCLPTGFGARAITGFRVRTVGQHASPGKVDAPEGSVLVPRTNFRFCLESTPEGILCNEGAFEAAARIDSTAPVRALEGPPSAAQPWRRIEVNGLTGPVGVDGAYRGPGGAGQAFRSTTPFSSRSWAWGKDLAAWKNVFPVPAATAARGLLAIQAETPAGSSPDPVFGFHAKTAQAGEPAKNLAVGTADIDGLSHLARWVLPTASQWKVRSPLDLISWLRLTPETCSLPTELCQTSFPRSSVALYRHPVTDFIGVVDEDGSIRDVGESLSGTVRELLASSAVVLASAEPSEHIGGRHLAPELVVLDQDLGGLRGVLGMARGSVRLIDTRGCGSDQNPCDARQARAAVASSGGSSPGIAVYAASLEMVFRVRGGASPEIAFQPLTGDGTWTQVPLRAGALGKIVAATYHAFDSSLWILDEVGYGFFRSFRLLRVSAFGSTVQEVARFPRTGLFDTHWLVSDHDGRILVAASSALLRRHVLVKVRYDETETKRRLLVEHAYGAPGELLAAPRVNAVDLELIVQRRPSEVPTLSSHLEFPGAAGTYAHLGGCF